MLERQTENRQPEDLGAQRQGSMAQETAAEEVVRPLPRLLVRIVTGIMGSLSGLPLLWMMLSAMEHVHTRDRLAAILVLPSMIATGLFCGWMALARSTPIRAAAWAVAGFGAGFLLDGALGCLGAGDVLGPSALVLSIVFMVIGYRERPK